MIKFVVADTGVDLEYQAENVDQKWVWRELEEKRSVVISSVFYYDKEDLTNPPSKKTKIDDEYWYHFPFGSLEGDYIRIAGRFLGIENDVLMPRGTNLRRPLFAAERNISIFGRLANLLENSEPIVIGGKHAGAIPFEVFEELLEQFPNTYEVDRYAESRVSTILSQHLDGMKGARGRYEKYLNKRMAGTTGTKLDLEELKKLEIEKYILLRDLIKDALENK